MRTKLLEFLNDKNQTLRGIITLPDGEIKKGVICLHGFERCSSTEKKFKILADVFAKNMIATFRFDFSGCGLSDGDFRLTTIEKQGKEFLQAADTFYKEIGNVPINIVAHSLGASIFATQIENMKSHIGKIIFIAPALNQKDLLRYWFVVSQMKKINPQQEITWQNYIDYLSEKDFIKDCERDDKMTKVNYIQSAYFLEGKDVDFSQNFAVFNSNTLHIHGLKDLTVPLESLHIKFENQILIQNGDHDLEKPHQMEEWAPRAIDFLLG